MKKCKKCLQEKLETDFDSTYYKDKTYLKNECKVCLGIRTSANYYADHERQKSIRKRNTNNRRAARKKILFEYLLSHPCMDCGETDPIVLEFDHISIKSFNISAGLMKPLNIFQEEIEKCEVVCANCHKKRTAKRAGDWYKDVKVNLE